MKHSKLSLVLLISIYNPPQKSVPKGRRHKAGGFSASGPSGRIFEGGLKGNWQKKWHMEVKTLKTTKSDIWCKNPSKSATIWNQTVSAITQARNDIFEKFQNSGSTSGHWLSSEFWNFLVSSKFGVVTAVWKRLLKKKHFRNNLCLEGHISGLEWTFAKL